MSTSNPKDIWAVHIPAIPFGLPAKDHGCLKVLCAVCHAIVSASSGMLPINTMGPKAPWLSLILAMSISSNSTSRKLAGIQEYIWNKWVSKWESKRGGRNVWWASAHEEATLRCPRTVSLSFLCAPRTCHPYHCVTLTTPMALGTSFPCWAQVLPYSVAHNWIIIK